MSLIKPHEAKLVIKLALPLMAAFLAQKGMQVVDNMMLGWLGPEALAAGAFALTTFVTILVFCMGTLSAVGVFIMHARGANQSGDIQAYLQQGLCLALMLGLPAMLVIWHIPQVLSMVGEAAGLVANAGLLLHGLVWGFPAYLLFLVLREYIAAFALTRMVMIITLCSIPLTFIINYVLMYGKYGMPRLGIAGIGFSGAIVMWLMFLSALFYCKTHALLKTHMISLRVFKFDYRKIRDMFYIGAPSGVMLILDMGMFSVAVILIGHFGADSLAAYQITMQWASIAFSMPAALSMATALRVGHAVGAKDIPRAARYAYFGLGVGLCISILVALIFIFAPDKLVTLFLPDNVGSFTQARQMTLSFLAIAALFLCFDALQVVTNGILKGFKDTLIPMLLSTGCYWGIGLGSAYYFAFYTSLGASGIWYGLTLGICSVSVVLMLRFLQRLRRELRY